MRFVIAFAYTVFYIVLLLSRLFTLGVIKTVLTKQTFIYRLSYTLKCWVKRGIYYPLDASYSLIFLLFPFLCFIKKSDFITIFHNFTVWNLSRQYTNRQISKESILVIIYFLEKIIKEIINECEILLQVNGAKNQRITRDLVETVINSKYNYILSENKSRTRGDKKEKKDNLSQLPNDVNKVSYYE